MGFRMTETTPEDGSAPGDPEEMAESSPSDDSPRRRNLRGKTIAVVPTLFTLGNLLCGFMAVFVASRPMDTPMAFNWTPLTCAAMFIFIGQIADALDGRVARMTRSTSELGEQLDSMADMVTFGVAPAFILVQIIGVQAPYFSDTGDTFYDRLGLAVAAIYVACAGLRLARFNIEVEDATVGSHLSFDGLPSPGAAGAVAGLALLHQHIWANNNESFGAGLAAYGLLGATLLCALAMVSRFRYVHVMNRYVRGRAPFLSVAMAVVVLLLLLVWPQPAIAGGFVAYAVSGPVSAAWRKGRG